MAGITRSSSVLLLGGLAFALGCSDPFAPTAGLHTFSSIDAGSTHTCALVQEGAVYCWGANDRGQLGVGDLDDRDRPTAVATDLKFVAVTTGDGHTCGLTTDGTAYCWGWNPYQQRGSDVFWDVNPVPVATPLRFTAIDAGWQHTCAIAVDGSVHCWGMGRFGELGNGMVTESSGVVHVAGDLRASQVSAGARHTCAVSTTGDLLCWGDNGMSQLGIGSDTIAVSTPTPVGGGLQFKQVSAGVTHTCAVSAADEAYCWGSNAHGETGDKTWYVPTLPGYDHPVPVQIATTARQVSAGLHVSCMIAFDGLAYCWGRGADGQIGNGNPRDQNAPQTIQMQPGRHFGSDRFRLTDIAVSSGRHVCGIVQGAAFCWGTGERGQLGARGSNYASLPQRVRD